MKTRRRPIEVGPARRLGLSIASVASVSNRARWLLGCCTPLHATSYRQVARVMVAIGRMADEHSAWIVKSCCRPLQLHLIHGSFIGLTRLWAPSDISIGLSWHSTTPTLTPTSSPTSSRGSSRECRRVVELAMGITSGNRSSDVSEKILARMSVSVSVLSLIHI